MLNYKVSLLKSAIAKSDIEGVANRQAVYYPQLVKVEKMDIFGLIDAIMNLGSTAFTRGEWTGVVSDLGSSIAQQLISGYKVEIPGLGTFAPVLETKQSNVKDPSKINSGNFTCSAKFTPDARFTNVLANVVWKRDTDSKAGSSSDTGYTLAFSAQLNNSNLKFIPSDSAILAGVYSGNITATVNGTAVANGVMTSNGIFLNDVIDDGATLTNATVVINMPAITVGEGDDAVEYPAGKFTITGVSQTGYANNSSNKE